MAKAIKVYDTSSFTPGTTTFKVPTEDGETKVYVFLGVASEAEFKGLLKFQVHNGTRRVGRPTYKAEVPEGWKKGANLKAA